MAKYGGSSVGFVAVDQFNLLPSVIESLNGPNLEAVIKEVTGLGVSWAEHQAPGVRKVTAEVDGYFDDAATGIVAAVLGNESASRIVTVAFHGNSYGAKVCCLSGGFTGRHARAAKVEDFTRARLSIVGSGQVDDDAALIFPLTTITVDTNTEGANSQDNGASSAGGAAAYIHVISYSGFTNIVAKVRHSADDVTYADLLTFSTITAVGAQRATVAGTVNRHTAVDLNVTGAGSAAILVALKRL